MNLAERTKLLPTEKSLDFGLVIKDFQEDKRIITGIATTPDVDRQGDIVETMGVQFKNPTPLLWQHKSDHAVGLVTFGTPTKKGLPFEARIESDDEAGAFKDRVDTAWKEVKKGLIRNVSIGFRVLKDGAEFLKDGDGIRFTAVEILELSLVTVPANAAANILTVKATTPQTKAAPALGHQQQKSSVAPKPSSAAPGASGKTTSLIPKGNVMTIKEQIAAAEAKRQAHNARMQELLAGSEGRTFTSEEQDEYDGLDNEVDAIDKHLVILNKQEKRLMVGATTVESDPATGKVVERKSEGTIISVKSNLAPGQKMARFAIALKRARGNLSEALAIVQNNKGWMDTSPELGTVLKAAVAAGDTTTAGWASELVYAQNLANDFIEYLRPLTIIGRIPTLRNVPFNVRVGGQNSGSTAYWVGQGLPIPVSKLGTTSASLGIAKAAGLVVLDEELVRSSSPSAELLVRDDLGAAVRQLVDLSFIDPNNGGTANVSPASMTYGLTPVTPSGTDFAAIKTDVKSLFSTAIAANMDISEFVWVMSPTTALSLSLMQNALGQDQFPGININGGMWFGLPVIVSQAATIAGSPTFGNIIVLLNPKEIFLADDGQVTISISNEASIQMLDNPTNQSAGATVATTMVSMFQTHSEAIKAVRFINWAKRRSQAAAYITNALYA